MAKVLIFTLASCGYHWEYRKNLESQRDYACKHGYTYSVVDQPRLSVEGQEIVWLKVYLLREALSANYDWVVFIDADAEVTERCPPIESVALPECCIYMAKGYSQRFNSGVMIFRNSENSRVFIQKLLDNRERPLPAEHDVGWGENGHVIHYAVANPAVAVIDKRWNNNSDCDLNDYIRHYSAGPLRALYHAQGVDHCKFRALSFGLAVLRRIAKYSGFAPSANGFNVRMEDLTVKLLRRYPTLWKKV